VELASGRSDARRLFFAKLAPRLNMENASISSRILRKGVTYILPQLWQYQLQLPKLFCSWLKKIGIAVPISAYVTYVANSVGLSDVDYDGTCGASR